MNVNIIKDSKYKFRKKDDSYCIEHQLTDKISKFTKIMSVYEVKEVYDVTLFEENRTFLIYYKDRNDYYNLIEGKLLIKEEVKPLYKFISTEPLQILEKGVYFGKKTGKNNHLEDIYQLTIRQGNDIKNYYLNTFATKELLDIEDVSVELLENHKNILAMTLVPKNIDKNIEVFIDYNKKPIEVKPYCHISDEKDLPITAKFEMNKINKEYPLDFLETIIDTKEYKQLVNKESVKVYKK